MILSFCPQDDKITVSIWKRSQDDSIDMEDDSINMEDDLKMTVSMWVMAISIREMTGSI